jgi:UDP-N-acetylglucosamine/UDP-N-acetylgalactosamine diphosphorylase
MDVNEIRSRLSTHGQEHLLRFYDQLDPPKQEALLTQLDEIDWERLATLIESHVLQKPQTHIPTDVEPPETISRRPTDEEGTKRIEQARQAGEELIAAGKVAVFVVAGGQGTRLGYEGPKGCFEATPVQGKSLFQVFAEQILAASRRHDVAIPWYIMTSPTNDVATRAFFRQKGYFGLDEQNVFFFVQGTMPAIGFDGKVLLADKGSLALSPDGHGGCLRAMRRSGALDDMAGRGVEYVSYHQVDNPMVRTLDPVFLGLHHQSGAEMSAKALPKRDPLEPIGNFCLSGGKVHVIEYSDMPEDLARQTTDDGHLRFNAGSIAIHIISRAYAERLTASASGGLPFHRAEKKVSCIDANGARREPEEPNAVKLEMFVFDAMPLSEACVLLETERDEEFSPIKNAEGIDSPATSLHDQIRRAANWLEQAGVAVPRDADGQVAAAIEISPLFADSPEELARRVDPDLKIDAGSKVYLGSRGQSGGLKA